MSLNTEFLHAQLHAARVRLRWARAGRFLVSSLAWSLFVLISFVILDAQFHFGAPGRWTGFFLLLAGFIAGLIRALPAWRKPLTEAAVARRIEGTVSGARNVLINAVQFDQALPEGSPFRRALFNEMRDPFPEVNWADVFDLKLLRKLAAALGVLILVTTLWAVSRPDSFANSAARVLFPARDIPPLTRTRIELLSPRETQLPHGSPVAFSVRLAGEIPPSAWLHHREQGGNWQKSLMSREVGQPNFGFRWKELRGPLEFYLEAGDCRSARQRLEVRPKTAIRARSARIEAPAYAELEARTVKDFTVLNELLPGSKVELNLEFNNPITGLRVLDEKGAPLPITKLEPTRWKAVTELSANQTLKVNFDDADKRTDSETLKLVVGADEPPAIRIGEPAEGRELIASRDSSLAVQFNASDKLGLASVALYRSTDQAQDAQLVQTWKEAAGQKEFGTRVEIPLAKFAAKEEERVTFVVIATDANNVSGPGNTVSRPIVVSLRTPDKVGQKNAEETGKARRGLADLIKLQETNLNGTRIAAQSGSPTAAAITELLNRQVQIADLGREVAAASEGISDDVRRILTELGAAEFSTAVLTLRNAAGAPAPGKFLSEALVIEGIILTRLQGAPAMLEADAQKGRIQDLIASVEDLLVKQKELLAETKSAKEERKNALAERQDALAERSVRVRRDVDANSKKADAGSEEFRARLAKVAAMFGELRIYEEMLAAAEKLQAGAFPAAGAKQGEVAANLAKIVAVLNDWQLEEAATKAAELKKDLDSMKERLEKLREIQEEIVERSRELARKDDFRPGDVATAEEINESKELMKDVIEQMLIDAHVFPDLKPSNELRSELTQIYEDVMQTDKQQAAAGTLKPSEIAVEKDEGLLAAIEKATQIAEDMEMWLPNKNETQKWLMENFDVAEMPEIPNLPLPDAFTDLVGDLLEEQEGLAQEIQDAASNQALAMNPANGWEVRDGPMPGFGAQGRSGNERPNKNEQTGRSSGGREGMSTGEMVGDTASNLEGRKADVRRTNDPMQQGQIADNAMSDARATGGGKAGGFSQREGMDGNAPLRATVAPRMSANDALAVKQALLAQKTSKHNAEAELLYLRTGKLPEVARLMDESGEAVRDGRMGDFKALHKQIVGRLNELKTGVAPEQVVSLPSGGARVVGGDRQLLGGSEGEVPAQYRGKVADYYRSLVEDR